MFCSFVSAHVATGADTNKILLQQFNIQKILWRVGCWLEVSTKVFTIFSEGLAYFSTCITHKCESTTKTYSKYYVSTKFRRQLYCCVLTLDVSIYICFFLSLRRGPKSMIEAARANFELNINNYCKLSVGTRMKRIAKIIGCYWTITGRVISAWLVIFSWQWSWMWNCGSAVTNCIATSYSLHRRGLYAYKYAATGHRAAAAAAAAGCS